jgi:hypothetical protein
MAITWEVIFSSKGLKWGRPPARLLRLIDGATAAAAVSDTVESGGRTAADRAQGNTLFRQTETETCLIKRHYLLTPPLTLPNFGESARHRAEERSGGSGIDPR